MSIKLGIRKIRTLASESFANDVSLCGDIVSITALFDAHTCSFSMNNVFDDLRISAIFWLTAPLLFEEDTERYRRIILSIQCKKKKHSIVCVTADFVGWDHLSWFFSLMRERVLFSRYKQWFLMI